MSFIENIHEDCMLNDNRIISGLSPHVSVLDYGLVTGEGKQISINYPEVIRYLDDIGYVSIRESGKYNLYKFSFDTGYYGIESTDDIADTVAKAIRLVAPTFSFPVNFVKQCELNTVPFLNNKNTIMVTEEFIALKQYYEEDETIPFKNGIYCIKSNRFLPKTSCMLFYNPLNVNFNPDAIDCDIADKYREMMDSDECFEYLFELAGYILYANKLTIPSYVVLYGSGANGKSIVIDSISRIIGLNNISCVSLENMTDPHMVASCEGKRANIVADAGAGYKESAFKSISNVPAFMKTASAGENWLFNQKYEKPHIGRAPRMFLFASNNFLNLGDVSSGTSRRLHSIPFNKTFEEDYELSLKFKTGCATEWFAMKALEGYIRVIRNAMGDSMYAPGVVLRGKFSECDASKDTNTEMMVSNSVILDFLHNAMKLDITNKKAVADALIGREDVYEDLKAYCDEIGRPRVSQTKFTQTLAREYKIYNNRKQYKDSMTGVWLHKYVIEDRKS